MIVTMNGITLSCYTGGETGHNYMFIMYNMPLNRTFLLTVCLHILFIFILYDVPLRVIFFHPSSFFHAFSFSLSLSLSLPSVIYLFPPFIIFYIFLSISTSFFLFLNFLSFLLSLFFFLFSFPKYISALFSFLSFSFYVFLFFPLSLPVFFRHFLFLCLSLSLSLSHSLPLSLISSAFHIFRSFHSLSRFLLHFLCVLYLVPFRLIHASLPPFPLILSIYFLVFT